MSTRQREAAPVAQVSAVADTEQSGEAEAAPVAEVVVFFQSDPAWTGNNKVKYPCADIREAALMPERLMHEGLVLKDEAGPVHYIPAHRIARITVRILG